MGVHNLHNYAEIKKLLGIPEQEPIFILRAQDGLSRIALSAYADIVSKSGCSMEFEEGIYQVDDAFLDWQQQNNETVKLPD